MIVTELKYIKRSLQFYFSIKNRKGSAIAFSLIIAGILLLSEAFFMNQNRNNILFREKNIENLQSYFAARAGMQHVMLKAQILPTQLYDAACFSVGKNPFFDFTHYIEQPSPNIPTKKIGNIWIKLACSTNPGPRFLVSGSSSGSDLEDWMTPPDTNLKTKNPTKYLEKFIEDISFNSTDYPEMNYPYSFSYAVASFTILSLKGQRKYNEEAIQTTVIGRWHQNPSNTGTEKEFKITSIVRIQRNE